MALQFGYPEGLQNKLLKRKTKCIAALREGSADEPLVIVLPYNEEEMEPNPSMPHASNAIRRSFTSDKGRHLVAKRDIRPGRVLSLVIILDYYKFVLTRLRTFIYH